MRLRVRDVAVYSIPLQTRIPFRYGITTMRQAPHVFVRAALEVEGGVVHGTAADLLAPKWFTKNPETGLEDDFAEMLSTIRHACRAALELGKAGTVFDLWRKLSQAQRAWAEAQKIPPLLWGFGLSLVERACLDAFCRATAMPLARAVIANTLGIHLGDIHQELAGREPAELLPAEPLRTLTARHTVGLTDPLTDAEILPDDRVEDGLPQSLEACISRYGLTRFKIKLGGDNEHDRTRLRRLAELLERQVPGFAFTLDGNENYRAVAPFRELWETLRADAALAPFLERLIFVEQPLHRAVALNSDTATELHAWPDRPPMIIDESDGEPRSLRDALDARYIGVSHKNCKGVFRGIANACLLAHRRAAQRGARFEISGEDLVNVGPVALLQDLAAVAMLGITHVERNGHHYFAGLSQFPDAIQQQVLRQHGDLYVLHPEGFPTLAIERGELQIGSVVDAPFGTAFDLDVSELTPVSL